MFFRMLGTKPPSYLSPTIYLGKISFGLYVYHLPCILLSLAIAANVSQIHHDESIFSFVVDLPLTLGRAALPYRFFESPLLRLKERFEIVQSRPV